MANLPVKLLDHFQSHQGIVNTSALKRLHISNAVRELLIRVGLLVVVHEGVYRLRGWPETFESRCAALCAADPSLVICCRSAGRLQGLRTCAGDTIHALTTRTTLPIKPAGHDVVIHRTNLLPKSHIIRRADGIRMTNAARLLFDEARHRDGLMLESVMEDAIAKGKCTVQTLWSMAAQISRRGRPGAQLFGEVLRSRPAWRRAVDSHPELVLRDALSRAGLELTTQPSLTLTDGRTIHPDLGDVPLSFFIEVDDNEWHNQRRSRTRDYVRDRQATISGARVVRVGTDEIGENLDGVVAELLELHAARVDEVRGPDAA